MPGSIALIFASVVALFLSCNSAPESVTIAELRQHPFDYSGVLVTISGTTTESMNLFAVRYFKLRDETGEMVVLPVGAVPPKGQQVKVIGTIDQLFSYEEKQLLVFIEDGAQAPKETMQGIFGRDQ